MSRLSLKLFALLIFLFALTADAQQGPTIEYGAPGELRGVTKVFVDTGMDAQQREKIVAEIQRKLPQLLIVARPEDTDVHLRFEFSESAPVVVYPQPYPIPATRGREGVGTVVRLLNADRVRVLMSFRDFRGTFLEREPSVNFARDFIKAYEKANH